MFFAGVNHEDLVELAQRHFGSVTANYDGEIPILPHCRYTGSDVGGNAVCVMF